MSVNTTMKNRAIKLCMHACIFNHCFHFVFPVSAHYKLKQLDYILVRYMQRCCRCCNAEYQHVCSESQHVSGFSLSLSKSFTEHGAYKPS